MKMLQLLILTVAMFVASNVSYSQHTSDPKLIAEGAKLYSENCGRCHNARPASDYSKKEWSVVMPHMREKAHMTGTESLAVEAFLNSTLTSDVRDQMSSTNVEQVKRSPEEMIAQFGCQGCHQINGSGGSLGPTLDGIVEEKSKEFMQKKLRDPKFNNASSAMPQFPMSDEDIDAIIQFLSKE
jgi:mono/diheme cytochrome c family protein